jgi:hypothetical protein
MRSAKEDKKARGTRNLKEVGYGVAGNVDASHGRHALHRRVKTWVEVANGKRGGGNADKAAAKRRQRKGAKKFNLQEFAQCNRADHGRSEKEYSNAQSNIKLCHLVSLMMLLPISQCVRGDDAPMDISSAEQCSTPGSLIPACLTLSLFSLQPSLHLQPTCYIFSLGERVPPHTAPMMLCKPSFPILLLESRRTERLQEPEARVSLTRSAVSQVRSLSVKSKYLRGEEDTRGGHTVQIGRRLSKGKKKRRERKKGARTRGARRSC